MVSIPEQESLQLRALKLLTPIKGTFGLSTLTLRVEAIVTTLLTTKLVILLFEERGGDATLDFLKIGATFWRDSAMG